MMRRRCGFVRGLLPAMLVALLFLPARQGAAEGAKNVPPEGFTAIFNGDDLAGWHGLVGNPKTRAEMTPEQLAAARDKANQAMRQHWRAEGGEIVNDGHSPHLCTDTKYGDFEMWIDWKIVPKADSGIYLRGTPQVQIWDPVAGIAQAKVGSGGLYNNRKHPSKPLVVADNPAGEWNTFWIRMIGETTSVKLNGKLVVDNTPLENYWDRSRPIYPAEQIELQTHGGEIRFRNIFLREIAPDDANAFLQKRGDDGFQPLFNGKDLAGWQGSVDGYLVASGVLICDPKKGGTILTVAEYDDFAVRFEFKLPPGGNNGLGIRTPPTGNPAYVGMEIQILDDSAEKWKDLKPYQYHGSIYGVVPAHRGYLRPVGQWNFEEVVCKGSRVTVSVNGTVIVDADLAEFSKPIDGQEHPGLKRTSGHIGFMGHGDRVEFRNIRVKRLGE